MVGIGKTLLNALFGAIPLLARDIGWKELPRGQWSTKAVAIGRGLAIASDRLYGRTSQLLKQQLHRASQLVPLAPEVRQVQPEDAAIVVHQ